MKDEDPDLVEQQGVNAGPPAAAEPPASGSTESAGDPPDEPDVPGNLNEELAGVPDEKPGYPGQQRSVDTS